MSRFMNITNQIRLNWLKLTKTDRNEVIRDLYLDGYSFGDIVELLPKLGYKKISRQRIGKIWKDYYRHLKPQRKVFDKVKK